MRLARVPGRPGVVYTYLGRPRADFGFPVVDLVRAPGRFWSDPRAEAFHLPGFDPARLDHLPDPTSLLTQVPAGDNVQALTRRTLNRLRAYFLVGEDPQRRLEAREVVTLVHQASLVRHVLDTPGHPRVLIADEVGLGKTIEAGLIIQELLERRSGLRVLYLAPARLVSNVVREFRRLGLAFRRFAVDGNAELDDPLIVASIHRACHPRHLARFHEAPAWDVIIADECHHLSDWAPGGGDPTRKYHLVQGLLDRMPPYGRVVLMSGTPHQGHQARFENLLSLLRRPDEPEEAVRGRVIFRTKEHIRDWHGQPLFPHRQVNSPLVVDLGSDYREWLEGIRRLYAIGEQGEGEEARMRAAGWRCAQAMQWATSSVQAGVGYLSRQALRAGWDVSDPVLRRAAGALRPYRLGPLDEPVDHLLERMRREVDGVAEEQLDLEEAVGDDRWVPDQALLGALLDQGAALIGTPAATVKWERILAELIGPAGTDKVVLFAQPVETVTSFVRFIESRTGGPVALIIGGQDDESRTGQVRDFCRSDGPQFLVSSRAGSEGINLQVSRRLIHLDVPWNPMEMEQRVGRVHRFGSRRTILVDTVVTEGSPEVRCYERARERLRMIASALGSEEEFEALYSRVMSLIPPEELQQAILGDDPEFDPSQGEISDLVSAGYATWQEFHERFAQSEQAIRELDRGQADWPDLEQFLIERLRGELADGFQTLEFRWAENEIEGVESAARVIQLHDRNWLCQEHYGMPVEGQEGQTAAPIGLNSVEVVRQLRDDAQPAEAVGAAWLRWQSDAPPPACVPEGPVGILIAHRMLVRPSDGGGLTEQGGRLVARVVSRAGEPTEVDHESVGAVVRALLGGTVRREPGDQELGHALVAQEAEFLESLGRQSPEEREQRIMPAVTPLVAAVVAP